MIRRALFATVLLAACAYPAPAVSSPPAGVIPTPDEPTSNIQEVADDWPAAPPQVASPFLTCGAQARQGGAVLCQTVPGATLALEGKPVAVADANGVALIGFERSLGPRATVSLVGPVETPVPYARRPLAWSVEIAKRTDPVSRFKLECSKIEAQTPEQKRQVEQAWIRKDEAMKRISPPLAEIGFSKPTVGPYSSPFGAVRTYVPATDDCEGRTSVHYGLDIAAPTGTPIVAPMAGTVILADADLYYEGAAVYLDHGHGLVSMMMHMSRIDVKAGDQLQQGDPVGLVGATGRVTGPHLHWGMKWRNTLTGKREDDVWLDPALLLQLAAKSDGPAVGGADE